MSVWGEPRACELVRQLCSTRASACPALPSVWLCSQEEIDASGRIPADWSCQSGHYRSSTCCWAGAGGVQGHALYRCPENNLVSLTGWLSFWTSSFAHWCQCWGTEGESVGHSFVLFAAGFKWMNILWLRVFMIACLASYLECGSKVFLISSGLTKYSDSCGLSPDTLSRSRLSLLPSHMLSLEEEEKKVHQSQVSHSDR